jgi:hypothetical protein
MTETELAEDGRRSYIPTDHDKYEAIGRFVQAFELIVDHARIACKSLLRREGYREKTDTLLDIIFHHHSLTARPLFDIMRFMTAQVVHDPVNEFKTQDRDLVLSLLKHLANSMQELVNVRNNVIHATWYIGISPGPEPEHPDFAEIYGKKLEGTKKGIGKVNLPENIDSFIDYIKECYRVQWLITYLSLFISSYPMIPFEHYIQYSEESWSAKIPFPK